MNDTTSVIIGVHRAPAGHFVEQDSPNIQINVGDAILIFRDPQILRALASTLTANADELEQHLAEQMQEQLLNEAGSMEIAEAGAA